MESSFIWEQCINTLNHLNYFFESRKCPPQHKDLMQFENDLPQLMKNVKFKKVGYKFLDQLHKDIPIWNCFSFLQTKLEILMKQLKTPTVNC